MRSVRSRVSRRELALVAAALLVPIPLFAVTGLTAPLPNAIERGLGGLVTVHADDERSGTTARLAASESGSNAQRSADGSLVTRARRSRAKQAVSRASSLEILGSDTSTGSRDETTTGQTTSPGQGGDGNGGGASGEAEEPDISGNGSTSADSSTVAASPGSPTQAASPSVQIGVAGQGAGTGVSAGGEGVAIGLGADGAGTGSGEPGRADATVADSGGSSTGVGVDTPGIGRLP